MFKIGIDQFIQEDLGSFDPSSSIFDEGILCTGFITCEEDAVVAGLGEAMEAFSQMGMECNPLCDDGDYVSKGSQVMRVTGPVHAVLKVERVALNLLMRMSGIATATRRYCDIAHAINPDVSIAGTRKTTPGFRFYEKKAISLGGGWPHRNGLYDMVMIKDNHIAAAGGLERALKLLGTPGIPIEVEVETIEDGIIAARHGVDVIMADHMSPEAVKELSEIVHGIDDEVLIEVSGNMDESKVRDYAEFADIISIGALTHSVKAIHFSLDIEVDDCL